VLTNPIGVLAEKLQAHGYIMKHRTADVFTVQDLSGMTIVSSIDSPMTEDALDLFVERMHASMKRKAEIEMPHEDRALRYREHLSQEQKDALDGVRARISDALMAETEAFEKAHPDLVLSWGQNINALIRRS
jgi:hypothetical protein